MCSLVQQWMHIHASVYVPSGSHLYRILNTSGDYFQSCFRILGSTADTRAHASVHGFFWGDCTSFPREGGPRILRLMPRCQGQVPVSSCSELTFSFVPVVEMLSLHPVFRELLSLGRRCLKSRASLLVAWGRDVWLGNAPGDALYFGPRGLWGRPRGGHAMCVAIQLVSVFCVFTWFDGGFIYICRYGGSVVPAMLSASGIRVFTMKLRGLLHQSAKSCCQVARSCFKGILRVHRHSLFSFTIQMLVQSVLLKYWFAETARYQNGQGSTASCAFVNFLNIDRAEQLRRCFPQYPKMCIPGSQRPGATVWT